MQLFYRIMQFSRRLNPRRTAANDGDIDLTVRAQISRILEEQVQHLPVKTARLMRVIEEDIVLFSRPARVEIIRGAAQRHHQRKSYAILRSGTSSSPFHHATRQW